MTEKGLILNSFRYGWFDIDRYTFEVMSLSRYGLINLCSPSRNKSSAGDSGTSEGCLIWQVDPATFIQCLHVREFAHL